MTPRTASAAYAAEFTAAVRRLSAALHEAASLPALREAVAWQNRHALATGIDALVRRGPRAGQAQHQAPAARGAGRELSAALLREERHHRLLRAGGLVADRRRPGIRDHARRSRERSLAARVTYLEGWAVRAIMADHATALRPWLVPRRMPFVGVDGTLLRLPLAPPVPLTPAEAAVLRACDGIRDAREVAAAVLADPLGRARRLPRRSSR